MYIWPLLRSIFCFHLFIVLSVGFIYIICDFSIDFWLLEVCFWWTLIHRLPPICLIDDFVMIYQMRYLFILFCIMKSKFFTINVSIVDMRSLYYQLIVIVVCNAFAISVFFAVIYLFIILDVCECPLLYGVLVILFFWFL